MAKIEVFGSAGHGGIDPGAVGNGLLEKNINLQILLAFKDDLERSKKFKVITSRTKDENDPVGEEVKEANKSKAKAAASFHTNAGGGDGSETYHYSKSEDGKRLAELCEKHTKAIGQNSRGVKKGDHLYFINGTDMVAVLCECAFIDSKDSRIVDTAEEQKKFGIAYAKAFYEYFNVKYPEPVAKKLYRVQAGAYSKKTYATSFQKKLKKAGFTSVVVKVGNLYKVQLGAYSKKANATTLKKELKKAGFKSIIVKS